MAAGFDAILQSAAAGSSDSLRPAATMRVHKKPWKCSGIARLV
jgi:hypothetical protein